MTGDLRLALLAPYWDFFEASVPFDLRADRAALLDEVAALVGPEVCWRSLVDGEAEGAALSERIRSAGANGLAVVVSMCAPPTFALSVLDELPDLALLVCVVSRRPDADITLDHARIVTDGGTVGGPQLTNVLHRRGRAHRLLFGRLDPALGPAIRDAFARPPHAEPPARRNGASTAAGGARATQAIARLRSARLARVGRPIPGYECVDCDADALRQATGIALVDVEPGAVRRLYLAVEQDRVAALVRETRETFRLAPDVADDECLTRSLRFAAAMETLDAELGASAGAMNCHVPELRLAPDVPGIAPCYGLGRETSRGIPWTCSGDVVTAVAMLTLKLLGAAALYHEIETLDDGTDEALLANSGEHDLAFADPQEQPLLRRNRWWQKDGRCSACACFGPPEGPATLLAFTPHAAEPSGFRFVVAEGHFTPRRLAEAGTVAAGFRFASGRPVTSVWADWARAGVNHHSAATPGLLADDVGVVARGLGVGCVRVS